MKNILFFLFFIMTLNAFAQLSIPDCDKVVKLPNDRFTSCSFERYKADCFIEKFDYKNAIKSLEKCLIKCDTTFEDLIKLTLSYEQIKDSINNEFYAKKTIELYPNENAGYFALASLYYRQDKLYDVTELFEKTPAIDKNDAFCFLAFMTYWRLKQMDHAKPYIEKAIALNSEDDNYKLKYAGLLAYLKETEKAISLLEGVKQKQKKDQIYFQICEMLAKLYLANEQKDKCCLILEEIKHMHGFQNTYTHLKEQCN